MSVELKKLYKIEKKDIRRAGAVLADAFQHDPFWKEVLEEATIDQRQTFFEGSVRYCFKYGNVFATSEQLEGVAAFVPGDFADMTFRRAIRSGSFRFMVKMGMKIVKLAMRMKTIFEPMEADRRAKMKGRKYIYLIIIGVASEFQGQGFGKKLLGGLIEESDRTGVPIYLETETERNAGMYERLGFRSLDRITLPVVDLPMWEMLREPSSSS